ncbi:ATP-binding protein [Fictibacillus phosphorivorans]|uniref:ATP-binding protein n=1 Tax=Fictibacillus phosphorivorans TaxID=1221500 RepID=UPI002041902D|nr:ATP-binding protein [Fictibacillus phosphorivorans]MCM3719928.1 ATP-binding protein [Fictibacillus phosphorivorans]MCM3777618.1 ATP-binding protein [Fictibacillus phosphorivorans]
MIIEKLLLHVLIVIAPVLSYSFLFESKKIGKSPYFLGVLYGVSASLCMYFAYMDSGLYWDLRYVPLVLSIFYGGPISGIITLTALLATRTAMDGETLYLAYISAFVACIVPFMLYKYFWRFAPRKRIYISILAGLWPAIVQLLILVTYLYMNGKTIKVDQEIYLYIAVFGIIQILAVVFGSILNEAVIERNLMKDEIRRSEKQHTLGELAASIAHEVRNPLTVVKGFLQLMEGEDERHKHYYPLILSELSRAESIISDYLNFAKPEFKKIETFSIAELVTELSILLNPYALKDGITLSHSIATDVKITTDRNQLKQALINILKNAVEATPKEGRVSIKLVPDGEQVKVIVRDTGKGMSKEQLSRIGSLFFSTKQQGTGLGTMVSIRIIESMGGKVEYTSKIGKGTKVSVSLPLISSFEEETV